MLKKLPASESSLSSSQPPEVLSFDQGLIRIRRRIDELFEIQHVLTVAINGSHPSVGKTFLSGQITSGLIERRIPAGVCDMPGNLITAREQVRVWQERFEDCLRQVYILGAWEVPHGARSYNGRDIRKFYDSHLYAKASALGISLKRVDLWVGLYSAEHPFRVLPGRKHKPYDPFEDVLIRNDKVQDR